MTARDLRGMPVLGIEPLLTSSDSSVVLIEPSGRVTTKGRRNRDPSRECRWQDGRVDDLCRSGHGRLRDAWRTPAGHGELHRRVEARKSITLPVDRVAQLHRRVGDLPEHEALLPAEVGTRLANGRYLRAGGRHDLRHRERWRVR
jgi:hypothetical protein